MNLPKEIRETYDPEACAVLESIAHDLGVESGEENFPTHLEEATSILLVALAKLQETGLQVE